MKYSLRRGFIPLCYFVFSVSLWYNNSFLKTAEVIINDALKK